jgi:hypothetical protein
VYPCSACLQTGIYRNCALQQTYCTLVHMT